MSIQFLAGKPGTALRANDSLGEAVQDAEATKLRAGFAFASRSGIHDLFGAIDSTARFQSIQKEIIVGVGNGITEPAALMLLLSWPNTSLRLFVSGTKLNRHSVEMGSPFHAKFLCVESGANNLTSYVSASSANLTRAAQGVNPKNFEFGIAVSATAVDPAVAREAIEPWWLAATALSIPATDALVKKYANLRLSYLREFPAFYALQEPVIDAGQASSLWIHVGLASGIQRHQVEFSQALASFFGPLQRQRVDLELTDGTTTWAGRPLSWKETSFGVDIWRLGMPTIATGGVHYQNRVVHFRRLEGDRRFAIEVADTETAVALSWQRIANERGALGQTGGSRPRLYGFY
jgi:hypothetical protein